MGRWMNFLLGHGPPSVLDVGTLAEMRNTGTQGVLQTSSTLSDETAAWNPSMLSTTFMGQNPMAYAGIVIFYRDVPSTISI